MVRSLSCKPSFASTTQRICIYGDKQLALCLDYGIFPSFVPTSNSITWLWYLPYPIRRTLSYSLPCFANPHYGNITITFCAFSGVSLTHVVICSLLLPYHSPSAALPLWLLPLFTLSDYGFVNYSRGPNETKAHLFQHHRGH